MKALTSLLCVLAVVAGCRDPRELENSVTAILIVTDVDDDNVVDVDVSDRALQATPRGESEAVSFSLALAVGSHDVDVVVSERNSDGTLETEACGTVVVVVPADASAADPVLVVVESDELLGCDGGDDDDNDDGLED